MADVFLEENPRARSDIMEAAGIHVREIGSGFLSSLGTGAIEMILGLASESGVGVLIVAKDRTRGKVCGFVCGATDTRLFYKDFLRRRFWRAAWLLAPKLVWPGRLWRAVETLVYPARRSGRDLPAAELFDIAVEGPYGGTGLGKLLFHGFAEAMSRHGVREFKVGTGEKLVRAQRFYEKLGARQVGSVEVHRGQRSFFYVYDVTARPGSA